MAKNLTYFITTHSNHFLDLTIEKEAISIYNFSQIEDKQKNPDGKKFSIVNVNNGSSEILKNLGVNNSSIFLANCSIWVEGISDRNYIKAFLKAYCKAENKAYPKEDIDFCFIEYAGSNLMHYNFENEENSSITSKAINSRALILADNDEGKQAKHEYYKKIISNTVEYLTTGDYREIENLLTKPVWAKLLPSSVNKKELNHNEGPINIKIKNVLEAIDPEKYKTKYIGEFLSAIKKKGIPLNKIWTENKKTPKTGSLKNKAEISYKVLEAVDNNHLTWGDFNTNKQLEEITTAIYNFIVKK